MHCGPSFFSTGAVLVNHHGAAVQGADFGGCRDDPLILQSLEYLGHHALLAPAVPTNVDRVPWAILRRQIASGDGLIHDVQHRIHDRGVVNLHVAALGGEMRFNHAELLFRELHDDLLS